MFLVNTRKRNKDKTFEHERMPNRIGPEPEQDNLVGDNG